MLFVFSFLRTRRKNYHEVGYVNNNARYIIDYERLMTDIYSSEYRIDIHNMQVMQLTAF